jgi:hypothetical protein
MACRIVNRAKHLLIVPLNSGKTLHLAPGESSRPIADPEINGNEKVAKLLRSNLIVTPRVEAATTAPSAAAPAKGVEPKKETKKK